MKTKHTPGEWKVVYRKDDNFGSPINVPDTIRTNDFANNDMMGDYQGCIICSLNRAHGNRPHAYKEAEANAILMAVAPELLKVLIRINNIENSAFGLAGFDVDRLKSEVSAVIKKATE